MTAEQNVDVVVEKGTKSYICNTCNKVFKHHSSHSRHQMVCGKEKQFTCVTCGISFNRNDALKRHMFSCKPKAQSFDCGNI